MVHNSIPDNGTLLARARSILRSDPQGGEIIIITRKGKATPLGPVRPEGASGKPGTVNVVVVVHGAISKDKKNGAAARGGATTVKIIKEIGGAAERVGCTDKKVRKITVESCYQGLPRGNLPGENYAYGLAEYFRRLVKAFTGSIEWDALKGKDGKVDDSPETGGAELDARGGGATYVAPDTYELEEIIDGLKRAWEYLIGG